MATSRTKRLDAVQQYRKRKAKPALDDEARSAKHVQSKSIHRSSNIDTKTRQAQKSKVIATDEAKPGFIPLPPELRNEIHKLALSQKDVVRIRPRARSGFWTTRLRKHTDDTRKYREPALLQVNKVIRNEASAMYFKANDFEVTAAMHDMAAAAAWLRTVLMRCGNDPFRHFNFYIYSGHTWPELWHIRSLTQLFADTGLRLKPRYMGRCPPGAPNSLFHLSGRQDAFREALEDAVAFGARARTEDWHEDWLDMEFASWLEDEMSTRSAKVAKAASRRYQRLKRQRAGDAV